MAEKEKETVNITIKVFDIYEDFENKSQEKKSIVEPLINYGNVKRRFEISGIIDLQTSHSISNSILSIFNKNHF